MASVTHFHKGVAEAMKFWLGHVTHFTREKFTKQTNKNTRIGKLVGMSIVFQPSQVVPPAMLSRKFNFDL